MEERILPKLTLIEVSKLGQQMVDLVARANAGEEIVLTNDGRPAAFLASCNTLQDMSSSGLIRYELPPDMGGYGWSDDEESRKWYAAQIEGCVE